MKTLRILTLILLGLAFARPIEATSIDRANMLKKHGLLEDAKRQFIDILYGDSNEEDKATALYNLGVMAFNEKDMALATDMWKLLVDQFPNSEEARRVAAGMDYLVADAVALTNEIVENEIARSYLLNGDFWSNDIKNHRWVIDSSWLDEAGLAVEWYDKVIKEFSRTPAAKLAYLEKFKTVMASEDQIAKLVSIYKNFSKDFPDDIHIPVLEFQIAQKYWALDIDYYNQLKNAVSDGDTTWIEFDHLFVSTRKWLETVVHNSKGVYKQTAQERLKEIDLKKSQLQKERLEEIELQQLAVRTQSRLDKFRKDGYRFPTDAKDIPHFAVEWQQDGLVRSTSYYFTVNDSIFALRGGGIAIKRPIEEFDNYQGTGVKFIKELIKKEK